MSEPKVDFEAQKSAEDYLQKAMDVPKKSSKGKEKNEVAALSEENRKDAIHYLLTSAQLLIPQDHPDASLSTVVEKWISQVGFAKTPGAS